MPPGAMAERVGGPFGGPTAPESRRARRAEPGTVTGAAAPVTATGSTRALRPDRRTHRRAVRLPRRTMESLVTMTTRVPDGVSEGEVAEVRTREAARTQVLALDGRVLRLWRPPLEPGEWRTLGLFAADGPADLERTLAS